MFVATYLQFGRKIRQKSGDLQVLRYAKANQARGAKNIQSVRLTGKSVWFRVRSRLAAPRGRSRFHLPFPEQRNERASNRGTPLTCLADAASVGVDLALEERMNVTSTSDPTMLPYPGTIGLYPPPEPSDPVLY